MEYESEKNQENLIRELSYPLYNGILYAWVPIWLGVLINGAANKMDMAYHTGNKQAFIEAQQKLNTFFVINSVIILITIVLTVLFFVAFFAGAFSGYMDMLHNDIMY